jgi:hypothetical protein
VSATRTPEEIRASIETNRRELGASLERLQAEWERVQAEFKKTLDWRAHLRRNQKNAVIGAAAVGFVLGGGVGGFFGLFRRS